MKNTSFYLIAFLLLTSCYKEKTTIPNPAECNTIVSYSADITPIIHNSCMTNLGPGTGCHDAWITNYNNITGYLDLGVWQTEVIHDKTMPLMPNDFNIDSLTADELQTMKCWIEQGYPEN